MTADLNCELLHVGNQARNMRRGLGWSQIRVPSLRSNSPR
jgi:hypothetical protein